MATSDPVWITIDEAFAKLKHNFSSRDLAIYALLDALKNGSLRALGRQLKSPSAYIGGSTTLTETELSNEIWFDTEILTRASDSSRLRMQIPALRRLGGSWYVFVDGSYIDTITKSVTNSPELAGNSKTGAQEKHSWSAAFAYCGWYVAMNGLPPTKKDLQKIVEQWFVDVDGGVPKGGRELYRRVSQAYDELLRSGASSSGGLKPTSDP